jgi:prepilin-type N-terminal cleavage/methylation domain-containing protein/prepilin-type processing-associated H-X9-DG protein
MKPRRLNRKNQALTLVEVLVSIAVLAVLAVMLLPTGGNSDKRQPFRVSCIYNLHQIGIAYQLWAGDHGDKYPVEISDTNAQDGTMELVVTGNVVRMLQDMSNELSTTKILVCPADTSRSNATDFMSDFTAKNISYFVGIDASENYPQRIISGDDNFAISGVPIQSGLLEFSTNAPISWTAARHKFAGNILLGDGSVQQVNTANLEKLFRQTGLATNCLAIP